MCTQERSYDVRILRWVLAAGLLSAGTLASADPLRIAGPTVAGSTSKWPSIEERYRLADRYLRQNMNGLLVDSDLRAAFLTGDRGVLYHLGPPGHRRTVYFDLTTHAVREIVADEPHGDEADGKQANGAEGVSPDGRLAIVSRHFNLVAIDRKSHREVPLTRDGTHEQPYGRGIPPLSKILAQGTEDPDMPVSVRWSDDSRYVLTWQLDVRGVEKLSITQQNPPGSFYPRSFHYIYPLAGAAKLPQARRLIIDVRAAMHGHFEPVSVDVPSESLLYPADPDMGWSNGKARILWTERGYGQLVVYEADPRTGHATVTARESVKPLVTVTSSFLQPAPLLGGELDVSERSGWAQLYLVPPNDPNGGRALTQGNWEVIAIDHVDVEQRSVLLTGVGRESDRNPYWRALYRVEVPKPDAADAQPQAPQLLTPESLDHEVTVSSDGRWAIDAMSSPTEPTRTVLRDTRDGHIVYELGRADAAAFWASGFTQPEPFEGVAADEHTPLYGMIYRPANFDPGRRYPVIDAVYTGPTTTRVPTSWNETVRSDAGSVAQLGAVVVLIDGRGTSRRGQEFRLPAYRNLGEVGIDDHIAMIQQMAARYPYMDVSRVGVYGGSAGGYDAARFILRRPSFFKVAVASSGNHDLRLDKAWWPEVSMGYADAATWERNSNMSVASNLTGKLLLIHGDIDDNVPVTESLRLARALIQANRDVDLVILPNTTHAVVQPFFLKKFRDYFTRNLLDEAPPSVQQSAADSAGGAEPVHKK